MIMMIKITIDNNDNTAICITINIIYFIYNSNTNMRNTKSE